MPRRADRGERGFGHPAGLQRHDSARAAGRRLGDDVRRGQLLARAQGCVAVHEHRVAGREVDVRRRGGAQPGAQRGEPDSAQRGLGGFVEAEDLGTRARRGGAGVQFGQQGRELFCPVVRAAPAVRGELGQQVGDHRGRPVQALGGQVAVQALPGDVQDLARVGGAVEQQLVEQVGDRRQICCGGGRSAHVHGVGGLGVGLAERPHGQRGRLVAVDRVGVDVGQVAGHEERDRAGRQLGLGGLVGRGRAAELGPVTGLPHSEGSPQGAFAHQRRQVLVGHRSGRPQLDRCARLLSALIGEDHRDPVPAHARRAAAALRGAERGVRGQRGRGAVGKLGLDGAVRAGAERGDGARVQLLGGAFDQAAVGQRRERVRGECQQVGSGHASFSATNSASWPGVIAPTWAPAFARRRPSLRS